LTAVVLTSAELAGETVEVDYRRIITDIVTVEVRGAGFEIVPVEEWRAAQQDLRIPDEQLILSPAALRIGQAVGADVVATGFHRVEDNRITIEIKIYGVEPGRLLAGRLAQGRTGLSIYNDINAAVRLLLPEVERALGPVAPSEDQDVPNPMLVLISDQRGVAVSAAGINLGQITDGRLELESLTEGDLEVELSGSEYHTTSQIVSVSPEGQEVQLKTLARRHRWGSEFVLTTGQIMGLGFGLRYYLLPDELFVAGDDYFFIQDTFAPGSQPVFHNDVRFRVGRYILFGPYSRFRLGASTGIGGVFTWYTSPELPLSFDLYWNVVDFWLEWSLERWSFFFRVEGKYALGLSTGILGRKWLESEEAGPPSTIGVMRKW
jgi:hypothetical protein